MRTLVAHAHPRLVSPRPPARGQSRPRRRRRHRRAGDPRVHLRAGRGIGMGTGRGFTLVAAPELVPARRESAGHRFLALHPRERGLARNAPGLARECGARRVVWNRRYEPAAIGRDQRIKTALREAGLETKSYNSALLHEPWTIHTQSGGPFQVFTAFWRACKSLEDPIEPAARSGGAARTRALARLAPARESGTASPARLGRRPRGFLDSGSRCGASEPEPVSEGGFRRLRAPAGPAGGARDLAACRRTCISARSGLGRSGTPHVAPRSRVGVTARWRDSQFLTEIGWREFAYHLLFHFPKTPEEPLRERTTRAFRGDRRRRLASLATRARPDTPSWMQGCASCGVPAGCTIACA